METTDPDTIARIRKGSTTRDDAEAIRLLRRHGILSMVGHIVGFEQETLRCYWRALRQLILYDPDLLNAMYVTPHRWTGFYKESMARQVIEPDQARWDYRHQILGTRHLRPWQIFVLVKLTEAIIHLRPRSLMRVVAYAHSDQRRAFRWCLRHSSRVWLEEIREFFRGGRLAGETVTLGALAGGHISQETPLLPAGRMSAAAEKRAQQAIAIGEGDPAPITRAMFPGL
jgi:anaerobic magnesium-protoporphyrin IX monomethyl ester cyclase